MLHYSLYKNNLITADPEDRLARPTDVQTATRADLIRDITGPGSILKPTETDAVIDSYWRKICSYLREGRAYRDDHISVRFSFRGNFKGDEDEFDPDRHELIISSMLKSTITGIASEVPLRKVKGNSIVPEIDHVYDWGSETTDEQLTPGDVLEISGEHLKVHENLEGEEGVFFVSQSDGSEIRATQLRTNKPKTLTLRIPEELAPGSWRLEVRNTRSDRNTLRTGTFTPVLVVG